MPVTRGIGPRHVGRAKFSVGDRVVFTPPFERCDYRWGYVHDLNRGFYRQTAVGAILVKLPSGLVMSVKLERLRHLHPLEELALAADD